MHFHVPVTVAMVKAEAARRIEDRYPIWKQINAQSGPPAEWAAMRAEIDHIRARSNAIEAMTPIPPSFRQDDLWT